MCAGEEQHILNYFRLQLNFNTKYGEQYERTGTSYYNSHGYSEKYGCSSPLGLFYASVMGGVIMLVLSVITLGFGLFVTWPGSVIWAAVAVNKENAASAQAVAAPARPPED